MDYYPFRLFIAIMLGLFFASITFYSFFTRAGRKRTADYDGPPMKLPWYFILNLAFGMTFMSVLACGRHFPRPAWLSCVVLLGAFFAAIFATRTRPIACSYVLLTAVDFVLFSLVLG